MGKGMNKVLPLLAVAGVAVIAILLLASQGNIPGFGGLNLGGPGSTGGGVTTTTSTSGQSSNELQLPSIDTSIPLPEMPAGAAKGEWKKKQLGSIEVSYFSTAIIRGMTESGTDYFIILKNTGTTEATVEFTPVEELKDQVPQWNLHFYALQDPPVKIAAGEEEKLWYYASIDEGDKTFTVTFKLWLEGDSNNFVELPVEFGSVAEQFYGNETSLIYGYVKDENGNPIQGVDINAQMNCGREGFRATSDSNGRYYIKVLAKEDIDAIYMDRELACDSTDYFVWAVKAGYEYYFKNNVDPTRQDFARLDITLEQQQQTVSYAQEWQTKVNDSYGFFWVKAADDFSVFAADQAKHPPELGLATNFYLFDSSGNVVWKHATENECWGIDIAKDGSKVIAGCHDNKVYMIDSSGNELWTYDEGGMVRSACISNDATKAVSGAIGTIHLFNAATGAKTDVAGLTQWLRNCKFYQDSSGFVAGSREVVGYDATGNKKWSYIIGEFPLFLATDSSKNTYASGKIRTLFSWDSAGNLRWKHRIPDHVVTAGAATPDGSRVALGTIGGMVYLFDSDGSLLWKRQMQDATEGGNAVGHNAVAISDDGTRVVAGSAPGNCVLVYNGKGTLVWQYCAEKDESNKNLMPGVNSVQISADNTRIVAAYGDNYVREFVLG